MGCDGGGVGPHHEPCTATVLDLLCGRVVPRHSRGRPGDLLGARRRLAMVTVGGFQLRMRPERCCGVVKGQVLGVAGPWDRALSASPAVKLWGEA